MSEAIKEFVKIPNPYDPYDFNTGRSYYNKKVVRRLKTIFESGAPQKIIYLQGKEGSGKSSTLNRIKNDAGILGERYIPIYIDLKSITREKQENVVLKLYETLRKPIIELKLQTKKTRNEPQKGHITQEDIRQTVLELTRRVGDSDTIVLLIFDDFDGKALIENKETYRPIIHTLMKVCKGNGKFRIILSGSDEIPETLRRPGSVMGDCLEKLRVIKMLLVDPKDFDRLIVEPVKRYVTYTPPALEEIKNITGGNLYCQQFLCHYIIRHLNHRGKYNCESEDVIAAARLMIMDRRDDFDHFWSRLDLEHKLVCSALMDNNIVFHRDGYYFIEAATLLDEIFDPRELKEILKRLYEKDFIHQPDGRQFKGFPFKIPLFGNWIKEKHPFIKTMVENIEAIANQKDLARLGRIVEKLPGEAFPPNHRDAVKVIQKWLETQNIMSDKGWIDRERTGELAGLICQILDISILNTSQPAMGYFIIDFSKLSIGSIKEAILVIQDRLEWSQTDIEHFKSAVIPHVQPTMPCLFLCFKKNDKIIELEKKAFLNIIPVEDDDIKNILFSSYPMQLLKELLLQRISSVHISPYRTEGPATTTFYGRQNEIRKLLSPSNQNFIILGARRIGKSSLIMRFKGALDNLGCHSIYADLESPPNHDYSAFLATMENEAGRCLKKKYQFNNSLDTFVMEMQKLKDEQKRVIIILDEVDELLKFDKKNDYQLIKALRNLSHVGCCQFILSGFEILYKSKREIDSPLYNFGEEMQLGPLEKQYALDLITEPMANIGIDYYQADDRELILEYTSCHPNLLQFFCKKLIEKISKDSNRRTIYKEDIRELFDFEYENYIFNEFYMFYEDLDELEKLIILVLAKDAPNEKEFAMAFINRVLKNRGVDLLEDVIHKASQKLMLRFIFSERKQGRYTFALPHFPDVIRKRDDHNLVEDLSRSLIERIKEKFNGKP